MRTPSSNINRPGLNRPGLKGPDVTDLSEIHSVPEIQPTLRPQSELLPSEHAESVVEITELPSPVAPLTHILGPKLTFENPAWSSDPIPRMRSLQKVLVEFSLALEENDRADCLTAISLVERAVRLRLRWQQMRKSEAEDSVGQGEEQSSGGGRGE